MDVQNLLLNIKTEMEEGEEVDDEPSFCKEEGELKLETCKVEVDTGVSEEILNDDPSFCQVKEDIKLEMICKVEVDSSVVDRILNGGMRNIQCDHCSYVCIGETLMAEHVRRRHGHLGRNGKYKCAQYEPSFCKEEGELELETCKVEMDTGVSEDILNDDPRFCQVKEDKKLNMICKVEVDSSVVDRTLNGGSLNIQCDHCEYVCIGETLMAEHVRRRHGHLGRNGKYRCTHCDYSNNHLRNMEYHQRTHTGEHPYRCDKCSKTFAHKSHLKQHARSVHDGLRPHVCDVCGKAFTHRGSLNTHRRIHSNTSVVQCEQCGQQFNSRSNYIRHMKAHDGVKTHRCSVCAARFVTRTDLTRHMRVHTGEKPHQCTHCELRFSRQSGLKNHVIAVHTHDYRHRCQRCNKGFRVPSELRKHLVKCAF